MQLLNMKDYGQGYSLLGWVVKLIFPGPVEAFLDPRVCPEPHHSWQQLWREGLCVLHPAYNIAHHLGISLQRRETRRYRCSRPNLEPEISETKPSGVKRLCFSGWGFSMHTVWSSWKGKRRMEEGNHKEKGCLCNLPHVNKYFCSTDKAVCSAHVEFQRNGKKFICVQWYLKLLATTSALTEYGALLKCGLCIRKNSRKTPETIFPRCQFIAFPEFLFFAMSPSKRANSC